ncbi:MAG: 50S ribosomal protein L3 [Spirochaetales bacterium]|nr:50S ribosomal protein L3 [Spirochaetales bacterium]
MLALMADKIGMTQIFDGKGVLIPVTVIHIKPNVVIGERNTKKHGYSAVILGSDTVKENKISKPLMGQFPEGVKPQKNIMEIRDFDKECKVGDELGVEIFDGIRYVDVSGISKGKGYQGVMKRHGFGGGRKTHGSKFHRAGGSTGMAAWPSKVMKGTRMAGRMGGVNRTVQNLSVVKLDKEKSVLLVKGTVPGRNKNKILVMKSKKK